MCLCDVEIEGLRFRRAMPADKAVLAWKEDIVNRTFAATAECLESFDYVVDRPRDNSPIDLSIL